MRSQPGLFAVPQSPNTFCGPAAIAALTGLPASAIEAAVRDYRTRKRPPKEDTPPAGAAVRTIWSSEVDPVLALLGWRVVERHNPIARMPRSKCPSFATWRREAGEGFWLVLITKHFVAVHKRKRMSRFIDTSTPEPILLRDAPHQRKRVAYAWRLEPYTNGVIA